jgi:hypothetical protein
VPLLVLIQCFAQCFHMCFAQSRASALPSTKPSIAPSLLLTIQCNHQSVKPNALRLCVRLLRPHGTDNQDDVRCAGRTERAFATHCCICSGSYGLVPREFNVDQTIGRHLLFKHSAKRISSQGVMQLLHDGFFEMGRPSQVANLGVCRYSDLPHCWWRHCVMHSSDRRCLARSASEEVLPPRKDCDLVYCCFRVETACHGQSRRRGSGVASLKLIVRLSLCALMLFRAKLKRAKYFRFYYTSTLSPRLLRFNFGE